MKLHAFHKMILRAFLFALLVLLLSGAWCSGKGKGNDFNTIDSSPSNDSGGESSDSSQSPFSL